MKVEDCLSIDIRIWQKQRLLNGTPFTATWYRWDKAESSISVIYDSQCINLKYQLTYPEEIKYDYKVDVQWTELNFGGERPWFLCPAKDCGRRVAILYCNGLFACRHCLELSYSSQSEDKADRALRAAESVAKKLGWPLGMLDDSEKVRPKGMHLSTFNKLLDRYERKYSESFIGLLR